MKRGRDRKARQKKAIRNEEKKDRELARTVDFDTYMNTPSEAPRIAERFGMWKWWLRKAVWK